MRVLANDEEILNLSDIEKQILCDDIHADNLDADIKRRLAWVINHKIQFNVKRLRDQWLPKLKDRVEAVPTDDLAFAQLVFSQEDYKDCKTRALESERTIAGQ